MLNSFKPPFPGSSAKPAVLMDFRFSQSEVSVPPIVMPSLVDWPSEETAKSDPSYQFTQLDWKQMKMENRRHEQQLKWEGSWEGSDPNGP